MTVTEKEFEIVSAAALEWWRTGRQEDAVVLDELARKMNRDLTTRSSLRYRKYGPGLGPKPFHIESPLEFAGLRKGRTE